MTLWKQKGQILLIAMLAIVVVSTVGLSLASKIITGMRTSTEEAESQKALAAAEAGIERAIQGSVPVGVSTVSNPSNSSRYTTTVTETLGSTFLVNGGNVIPKDEGTDLWLANYDEALSYNSPYTGTLTVYWGDSSTSCNNPALEIIILSGLKANPVSRKYAYDPCGVRRSGNNFSSPEILSSGSGNIFTKTFYHKAVIPDAISSGLIARIIPIYGNASVGVVGSTAFPLQGYIIGSTGTSGEANRMLTVFKGWPQTYLPYLSYGLFVVAD